LFIPGERAYLISVSWLNSWKRAVGLPKDPSIRSGVPPIGTDFSPKERMPVRIVTTPHDPSKTFDRERKCKIGNFPRFARLVEPSDDLPRPF
jgi:hypothetical protein